MKIAVLSGKGGTGKTFISVNLATVMANATYIDCDVEEPNGHLFFKPVWLTNKRISRKIPVVNNDKCVNCRICTEFCKFNALADIGSQVLVFEEICHSCGGCQMLCPSNAIDEVDKVIGEIKIGQSLNTKVISGFMNVKEVSGIPIIDSMLDRAKDIENVVIDCPPGSACSVMESIKEADYCILVAEPTIFGAHNLSMVHELVELQKKPYGVVLNKVTGIDNPSKTYCEENHMNILSEFSYDEKLAHILSTGGLAARDIESYQKAFMTLLNNILLHIVENKYGEVDHETAIGS